MTRYVDKDGKPLTLLAWANKFEDIEYRILGNCQIEGYRVSTAWYGFDLNMGQQPPQYFETCVFKDGAQVHCFRTTTKDEAMAKHTELIEELMALQKAGAL